MCDRDRCVRCGEDTDPPLRLCAGCCRNERGEDLEQQIETWRTPLFIEVVLDELEARARRREDD